jgi:3-hydroxyacyl-[acyl-carrier-protein] dehydratase
MSEGAGEGGGGGGGVGGGGGGGAAPEQAFGIERILELLPHRYPFLLVDRVVSIAGDVLRAYKNVSFNEPFFQGHFPGNPVMPGVLILEAMAQAAGLLALHTMKLEPGRHLILFASADQVKWRRPVVPGDRLDLEVEAVKKRGTLWVVKGTAAVAGERASEAQMMAKLVEKEAGA